MVFKIILTLFLCFRSIHPNTLSLCSEEFCDTYLTTSLCLDMPKECFIQNATHNGIFLPAPGPCNCCKYCLGNLAEGDKCAKGSPTSPVPSTMCGHGLSCTLVGNVEPATCQKAHDTPCRIADRKYEEDRKNGQLGHLQVKPRCDTNGFYEPVVCVPGEICYCLSEDGDRLFGDIPFGSMVQYSSKCQCSRNHHTATMIMNGQLHASDFFRCEPNGDFDALQCIDDLCMCIDPKDGHSSYPQMKPVNVTFISASSLPCYNNKSHSESEYYRECEKVYREQLDLIREYESQGIDVFGFDLPNCQLDGRFASVQENSTTKYCADPFGKFLENFQVSKDDPLASSMNCKCARTRSIMTGGEKPVCYRNGNYNKMQCRRGLCRCVDENGLQIEKEFEQSDKDSHRCV